LAFKKSNLEKVLNSRHVSFQHNQKTNLFIHEFGDSGHSCSSKGGYSLEANKNVWNNFIAGKKIETK
jgi:hypothetical protein